MCVPPRHYVYLFMCVYSAEWMLIPLARQRKTQDSISTAQLRLGQRLGKLILRSLQKINNSCFFFYWHKKDIEDLVTLGRRIRVCPYYATRDLTEQAQIVFSPYNYLIDPRVRRSMKIPIDGNIIILDEAHNIEDCARESAGGSWSQEDFHLALNDCEKVWVE